MNPHVRLLVGRSIGGSLLLSEHLFIAPLCFQSVMESVKQKIRSKQQANNSTEFAVQVSAPFLEGRNLYRLLCLSVRALQNLGRWKISY